MQFSFWSSFWLTVFSEIRLFTKYYSTVYFRFPFQYNTPEKRQHGASLTVWQFFMKRAKEVNIIATRISLDVGFQELKNTL